MTLSLVVHEVVGHGATAIICGGRFHSFTVDSGFAGLAFTTGVPPDLEWLVTYGGILINLAIGFLAIGAFRFIRPSGPWSWPLFWLGVTQFGLAVGYTFQGLIFQKGDARDLLRLLGKVGNVLGMIFLASIMALLAWWASRRLAVYVEDHFQPRRSWERRLAFFLAAFSPPAALVPSFLNSCRVVPALLSPSFVALARRYSVPYRLRSRALPVAKIARPNPTIICERLHLVILHPGLGLFTFWEQALFKGSMVALMLIVTALVT